MTKPLRYLFRWLAILPAVYLSWHIGLIFGMITLATVEALCPSDQKVSDLCVATWFKWAEAGIFMSSAGLAAALIVASAAIVAPAYRAQVACVVFVAGLLAAGYLAWSTQALKELVAAMAAGLSTVVVIIRWDKTAT